ncbi:hypothetical protein POM88_014939 [Heracleum sosnowskyi]|uniref:RNA polymerase subunit H/Rpb5 C-terminal domain-containing protein n=1 Tax=Heracleum sosnowskyi TaxID=360622 RepID=A0AAD8MVD7_9APIA|nr:hypothetical protein POM88_014939 [Heracleum sosnowskyi]
MVFPKMTRICNHFQMFFSTHYAGISLGIRLGERESWKKVFGSVFIYLNSVEDESPLELWADAKEQITDLVVNITKHKMLPKHETLSAEEQQSLLNKLDVQPDQIPRMLVTDPIVKYYRLEKGQILKVTYDGPSTGAIVTYRCVM